MSAFTAEWGRREKPSAGSAGAHSLAIKPACEQHPFALGWEPPLTAPRPALWLTELPRVHDQAYCSPGRPGHATSEGETRGPCHHPGRGRRGTDTLPQKKNTTRPQANRNPSLIAPRTCPPLSQRTLGPRPPRPLVPLSLLCVQRCSIQVSARLSPLGGHFSEPSRSHNRPRSFPDPKPKPNLPQNPTHAGFRRKHSGRPSSAPPTAHPGSTLETTARPATAATELWGSAGPASWPNQPPRLAGIDARGLEPSTCRNVSYGRTASPREPAETSRCDPEELRARPRSAHQSRPPTLRQTLQPAPLA